MTRKNFDPEMNGCDAQTIQVSDPESDQRLVILLVLTPVINVGKAIINQPPIINIFISGMNHSQAWVVYDIVLPTLPCIPKEDCLL